MARIIKCACDSNNCPAQLELIPEGKFMRVKSGGVTVAIVIQKASEIIFFFIRHFGIDVIHHAVDAAMDEGSSAPERLEVHP